MRVKTAFLFMALTASGLTPGAEAAKGSAPAAAPAAAAAKVNLHQIMVTKVNPYGLAIWDVTNNAMDDKGAIDGKKITAAQWAKLLEIGKGLEDAARTLATANGILAAAPGQKLQDEGGAGASTARDVQRFIDAKPGEFRKQALELQKTGAAVVAAATKRDAKQIGAVADSLDGVCEACHVIFWYPQQQKK